MLCVGGLDPSGGAGLLADAEAVRAAGGRPLCAATALTIQTARGVRRIEPLPTRLVLEQIQALLWDERPQALKLGMLATPGLVRALSVLLREGPRRRLVVDPVLSASSGAALFRGPPLPGYRPLLELSGLWTPNLPELEALLEIGPIRDAPAMLRAAQRFRSEGATAVLVKGGHLPGPQAPDLLLAAEGPRWLAGTRLDRTARGTGCRFAAALATRLALGDEPLPAARFAKRLVRRYLEVTGIRRRAAARGSRSG